MTPRKFQEALRAMRSAGYCVATIDGSDMTGEERWDIEYAMISAGIKEEENMYQRRLAKIKEKQNED